MKKNMLLCVDVITRLQNDALMKVGKNYKGVIRMKEGYERLEFDEFAHRACERNPTVWTGCRINVHVNKDGRYMIQMKQTELSSTLDPFTFADELFVELEQAKTELGL